MRKEKISLSEGEIMVKEQLDDISENSHLGRSAAVLLNHWILQQERSCRLLRASSDWNRHAAAWLTAGSEKLTHQQWIRHFSQRADMHSSLRLPIAGRSWLSHPSPIDTNTGLTFSFWSLVLWCMWCVHTSAVWCLAADLVDRSSLRIQFARFRRVALANRMSQSVTHVIISIANEFKGSSESKNPAERMKIEQKSKQIPGEPPDLCCSFVLQFVLQAGDGQTLCCSGRRSD